MSPIHELVRTTREGEKDGWNELYNKYYPGLYSIALQHSDDASMAKDMVQDAFITAYLKLHQLRDLAAFGGWIKKILLHSCRKEYVRTRKFRLANLAVIEIENLWDDTLNRQQELLSFQSNLYAIIANLPEVLRITLLLRYFSTFQNYNDIALILGIPVGTVRSRLSQAKLKLTEQWEKCVDRGSKTLQEGETWNGFYDSTLSGMHYHDSCKNSFIAHLSKNVEIVSPGGKSFHGNTHFERMIYDDQKAGSWLHPVNIRTSGNISVIELKHFNSSEYPDHCPDGSVMVIYRGDDKIIKLQLQVFK